MTCEEDVLRIGKKLDKLASGQSSLSGDALELLNHLMTLPITLEVLQKTRIGMTVNAFRKSSICTNGTANLAKQLIKNWKKLLDGATAPNNGHSSSRTPERSLPNKDESACNASSGLTSSEDSGISSQTDNAALAGPSSNNSNRKIFSSVPKTSDSVRLKCREMIYSSLKLDEMPDGTQDPEDLAERIENSIFEAHKGNTGDKYKASVRSRVFNLRDKKNAELRINVLVGAISPKKLATMTSDEMANTEMKNLRDKFTKEAINEHQMAQAAGTPTDMFRCGKCKGQKCTYTQLQTRSADEPMTTFVFCTECGNRWKFC